MYEVIHKALKEVGLDNTYEPQDYLNFFCLGNREAGGSPSTCSGSSSANNPQVRLQYFCFSRSILKLYAIRTFRVQICLAATCTFRIKLRRTGGSWCMCTRKG